MVKLRYFCQKLYQLEEKKSSVSAKPNQINRNETETAVSAVSGGSVSAETAVSVVHY